MQYLYADLPDFCQATMMITEYLKYILWVLRHSKIVSFVVVFLFLFWPSRKRKKKRRSKRRVVPTSKDTRAIRSTTIVHFLLQKGKLGSAESLNNPSIPFIDLLGMHFFIHIIMRLWSRLPDLTMELLTTWFRNSCQYLTIGAFPKLFFSTNYHFHVFCEFVENVKTPFPKN